LIPLKRLSEASTSQLTGFQVRCFLFLEYFE
jgi:hypothetical protein